MNRKSLFLIYSFFALAAFLVVEVVALSLFKTPNKDALFAKKEFVSSIGLPDLSISSESSFIRHRSLSDFFSIYKDDGTLRDYFASAYVFSASNIQNEKSHEK